MVRADTAAVSWDEQIGVLRGNCSHVFCAAFFNVLTILLRECILDEFHQDAIERYMEERLERFSGRCRW